MNPNLRRLLFRPSMLIAAAAVAGLCFSARAQQPVPGPGETPPALDAEEGTSADQPGEPDDLNAQDLARAVGEAEAEMDGGTPAQPAQVKEVPAAAANAVVQHVDHPSGFALWKKAALKDGAYVARSAEGKEVRLTIDPHLQGSMEKLLRMYKPVGAAVVAIDPKTGKILAMAEQGEGKATKPLYPAASVFK
ncbi:MAG TPA: hypothetical protein VFP52_05440, partial [Myxococcales bacterium]|nr:hypothetical protein [Myxococcales bacterium]